ncbi:unnamed protein product, partial [Prorocentrum cordatum]
GPAPPAPSSRRGAAPWSRRRRPPLARSPPRRGRRGFRSTRAPRRCPPREALQSNTEPALLGATGSLRHCYRCECRALWYVSLLELLVWASSFARLCSGTCVTVARVLENLLSSSGTCYEFHWPPRVEEHAARSQCRSPLPPAVWDGLPDSSRLADMVCSYKCCRVWIVVQTSIHLSVTVAHLLQELVIC